MLSMILVCGCFMVFGLLLSSVYLFNYLVILENFNVFILIVVLIVSLEETRLLFMSMMALFVLEISLMLIVVGLSVCGDSFRLVVGY
uniref:NADH dehydrogenase subunit 4L n=2 Tax=Trichobilharzia szidati TaxID=157070 RepID=A0A2R4QI80_9TREM|nr:NADH dehydrogenase subunit 4L [Trichobilharzia szidati]